MEFKARETQQHVLIDCLHHPELTAKLQPHQLNPLQIMKQVILSLYPYILRDYANSADPAQTSHSQQKAASD